MPVPPTPTPLPSTPQPTLPLATPIPTPELVEVGVPVIKYLNGPNELFVISSVTGKAFDTFTPIPLGYNIYNAFAADGHTLALVSDGQLYLIDLPSWDYHTSDVGLHGRFISVVYSPDETLLALASGEPDGALLVVDARSGEVKTSAQAGFSVRNVRFTTDGKAIMVYGPHLASTGVAANAGVSVGAPKAALFAISDLSVLWSVELAGIRDGTFPKKADTANTQDIYQPGAAWHYAPGIAFDPNSDILYAVHGDEDKLTTVDFTHRKVSTVDVHVKTSWLDQLMALTAGVAYAKGMDGTTKQAVISPDGEFLFVGGNTEVVTQQADGNWDITDTAIGLQVIAVEDGTFVNKINTEASPAWLSPNGRQVFLTGWKRNTSYGTPWTNIYDISSSSIVKHLDGIYLIPTRRMDGKVILVSSNAINESLSYMASVEPDTWAITGEWKGPANVSWLIGP
jgi:hypothetical protein